ncbi:MAG: hypothetical protein M1820_003880 [Bogoriella megaspora]|nr:MAG: hypothetical protein M1820_003880 [Bogoriella megaspora]
MATASNSVYSETLQSIINAKLSELANKRKSFEDTKSHWLVAAKQKSTHDEKLLSLLTGVNACFKARIGSNGRIVRGHMKDQQLELKLSNLQRFLEQLRYDPSVSPVLLQGWEDMLVQQLDIQSSRYEYASLYGQLVTEWLSTEKGLGPKKSGEDTEMSESFEELESKTKIESRAAWEKRVFEPFETDTDKIQQYLQRLFGETGSNKQTFKALKELRKSLSEFENTLLRPNQFSVEVLRWVIAGLLDTTLLTESKRTVLRDFNNNPTILSELADVLNLRMASLDAWSWGEKVPVEETRLLAGGYNMHMQEDLLQAILLQFIGVKWSVFLKKALFNFISYEGAWISSRKDIPILDKKRRDYFLGASHTSPSVRSKRDSLWKRKYFMSNLLDSEKQNVVMNDGAEEANFAQAQVRQMQMAQQQQYQLMKKSQPVQQPQMMQRAKPATRSSQGGMAPRKQMASQSARQVPATKRRFLMDSDDDDEDEEEEDDDSGDEPLNPMELKQSLLHILSAEILLNKSLHDDFTCTRAQFENWNPLLPHSTILTVISYLGVSETWLNFITKFLAAPLALEDGDQTSEPRLRKRGVPASHPLSLVLGEAVLFCLDLSVNQATGGTNLWRLHDDFWFWSIDHGVSVKAWGAVEAFISLFGLDLDENKGGTIRVSASTKGTPTVDPILPKGDIRWGFLRLSPESGRFEIDQELVTEHIDSLRLQLGPKTSSVFGWIQAWNAYAGTFFSTNFGRPANCFGQAHIDNILSTLKRVQKDVFRADNNQSGIDVKEQPGSVVQYLQETLHRRFGVENIPEGYVFFPAELGGLDLQNPLINYLQVHNSVTKDPQALLQTFYEAEKEAYHKAKRAWEKKEVEHFSNEDPNFEPEDGKKNVFMSFEEYTKYREEFQYDFQHELREVYHELLQHPKEEGIELPSEMMTALNLMDKGGVVSQCGINGNWHVMSAYWRWVVGVYGPEIVRKFGGLNIVDNGVLPVGMVGLVKDKRVKWSD